MKVYKELRELPEELEKWGVKALSKIKSPEKAQQAAEDLRKHIDNIWEECPSPETEEKIRYVLKQLGKADKVAEEWSETYAVKDNKKADKIVGVIFLILAVLCSIHPLLSFFAYKTSDVIFTNGIWQAGNGMGAGIVCAIFFLVFGMWLLLHSRGKKE